MRIEIELNPNADGWDLQITLPGRLTAISDLSGQRVVRVVTAELEAAIDRHARSAAGGL